MGRSVAYALAYLAWQKADPAVRGEPPQTSNSARPATEAQKMWKSTSSKQRKASRDRDGVQRRVSRDRIGLDRDESAAQRKKRSL